MLFRSYHRMLVRAPWAYQRIYSSTERAGGGGRVAKALLRSAEERLLRALPADTAAVVSTYPGASRVLGNLRLDGRLTVPVLTYLTDFSVHPLWVADGVDVHLALHAVPAAQARAAGARDVRVCGPVADPRFHPVDPLERAAARARFGLPPTAPLALLVAGSWGVGPVREVARDLRDCGAAVPLVVCGRNESLADQLRADGIEHVHGWVDDMPALMHAADVLVQNAGGLTSLEAFATGLPVASYGCIPGHGLTNADALDEAGVAAWIQDPAQLKHVLGELIDGPRGLLQREAGLTLFADEPLGPHRDPAAETARICRAAVGPAAQSTTRTTAPPAVSPTPQPVVPPNAPPIPRRVGRPAAVRLATTTVLACAVWAGAVGTAVATTEGGPRLIHAIGHGLDLDDLGHTHHANHVSHGGYAKGHHA